MALGDYQALVDDLVRDDTGKIKTPDRDQAIARAVARYSKDRPRAKIEDKAAPGGNKLALPDGWEPGFSRIRSLEYPIGQVPPHYIHQDRFAMYSTPAGDEIQIIDAINAGQSVRYDFTIRHLVNGQEDTIPDEDREPVCFWAASLLMEQLAAIFAGDSDSTIQADTVDHNSKSKEYAIRANTYRKRYFDELGIDTKRNVAASAVVNLDFPDSRGRDRLLHPARHR